MNEKLMYYFNYKLIGSMNVCWLESVTMVGVFWIMTLKLGVTLV